MKYSAILFLLLPFAAFAQIGIGTSSVNQTARLQVDADASSNSKGFLPPRVALSATNNNAPFSVAPATGLLVYNTATAGSGSNSVTPGFYYYDGVRWQRVINTQDAIVNFNTADPNTGSPTFTDGPAASSNYIYVSSVDNSQWTWNGTAYVTYTPPASTAWYSSGGTTDAGSSKTAAIYRSGKVGIGGSNTPNATLDIRTSPTSTTDPGAGFIGIGTTATGAAAAGSGAVRYNTSSGGVLEYSNGVNWNTLTSTVQKTVVTGYFDGTYAAGEQFLTCIESSDVTNAFSSNQFTAPRTGLYLITANLLTSQKQWVAVEELSIIFTVNGLFRIISPYFAQVALNTWGGPTISTVIAMNAGDVARFKAFNTAGRPNYTLYGENYNRFSITEL